MSMLPCIVRLSGIAGVAECVALRHRLLDETAAGELVVVDMSGLARLSTVLVATLVDVKRRLEERGARLTLSGVSDEMREFMRMTGAGGELCEAA